MAHQHQCWTASIENASVTRNEPTPHEANVASTTRARTPGAGWATKKKVVRAQDLPSDYETMPFVQKGYRLGYDSCGCLTSIFEVHNETINLDALARRALVRLSDTRGQLDGNLGRIYHSDFPVDLPEPLRVVGGLPHLRRDLAAGDAALAARRQARDLAHDHWQLIPLAASTRHRAYGSNSSTSGRLRCRPRARLVWMAQAFILLIVGAMLALECFPKRHSAKAFASLVAIGLLPTADFALHGTAEEIRQFVPKLMLMFFFYGLGFFFFSTKWPESRWPGRFCIVGASHQLWHTFVFWPPRSRHSDVRVPRARRARQPRRPLWQAFAESFTTPLPRTAPTSRQGGGACSARSDARGARPRADRRLVRRDSPRSAVP